MEQEKLEIWINVPGYENYQASNMGNIRSLDRTVIDSMGRKRFLKGRVLEGSVNKYGYRQIKLSVNGKGKVFTASQIVAMTYLSHTPDGHTFVVDHINGVKTDDRLINLRVVSNRENSTTCFRKYKKTLSSKYIGVYWSKRDKNWRAQIVFEGKRIHLGCFNDELKASEAYQKALFKIKDGTFNPDSYKPVYTSMFKGVSWFKRYNKWVSRVHVNGKRKHVGYFNTELEAYNAIQKFKQEVKKH